jgi:hypothetical protein
LTIVGQHGPILPYRRESGLERSPGLRHLEEEYG